MRENSIPILLKPKNFGAKWLFAVNFQVNILEWLAFRKKTHIMKHLWEAPHCQNCHFLDLFLLKFQKEASKRSFEKHKSNLSHYWDLSLDYRTNPTSKRVLVMILKDCKRWCFNPNYWLKLVVFKSQISQIDR